MGHPVRTWQYLSRRNNNNTPLTMSKTIVTLRIDTGLATAAIDAGVRPNGRKKRFHFRYDPPRFVVDAQLKAWALGTIRAEFPDEPDLDRMEVRVQWFA